MKRRIACLMLLTSAVLLLCSCDKNIKKVEEMTNQFIDAVNKNDSAGLYNIYPTARDITNMTLAGNIFKGEVSVEHDDSTGFYTATIQNQHHQKLVFSVDSLGTLSIIDSYGILQLDSLPRKLALKCGMPLKHVSDMEQAHQMDEKSLFLTYLEDMIFARVPVNYVRDRSGYWYGLRDGGCFVEIDIYIANSGTKLVEGNEYSVELQFDTPSPIETLTIDGVNILPGEIHVFEINEPDLFGMAYDRRLSWNVIINDNNSVITRLLKYGEFTGEEYKKFIEEREDYFVRLNGNLVLAKNEKKGHVDCYAEPSKDSKVIGTAYHRQYLTVVCDDKRQSWVKAYKESSLNSGRFILLGYIHNDEWVDIGESDLTPLNIDTLTAENKNGSDIAIYKEESTKSNIVKKVKSGSKLLVDKEGFFSYYAQPDWDFFTVYEPDGKGGYKTVGHIQTININFDK